MKIDIYAYTVKKFAQNSSNVLILTEQQQQQKKANKNYKCKTGHFVLVLFSSNIYSKALL